MPTRVWVIKMREAVQVFKKIHTEEGKYPLSWAIATLLGTAVREEGWPQVAKVLIFLTNKQKI